MADQLTRYVRSRKPQPFRPHPFYSKEGDFLTYFFRGDDYYAVRKDGHLTVYLSMDGNEFVGFKLKGVRLLFDTVGEYFVQVRKGGDLMLSLLVNAGLILSDEPAALPDYQRAMRDTKSVALRTEEFEFV
jgi:hypothetical protein